MLTPSTLSVCPYAVVLFLLSKQTLFLTRSNLCSIWYNSAHMFNKPSQGWRFSVLCSQDIDSVSKYVYIVCVTFSKTSLYLWELIYLHTCMFMKVTPLWCEAIRQGMTFALKNQSSISIWTPFLVCGYVHTHVHVARRCEYYCMQSTRGVFLYHSQPCLLNKVFHWTWSSLADPMIIITYYITKNGVFWMLTQSWNCKGR